MGDYTKLIVNCGLDKVYNHEELEEEIRDVLGGLGTSFYQPQGEILHLESDDDTTYITLVCQKRYGYRIDEFIDWLYPKVTIGMGQDDAYALTFTEYCSNPAVYFKDLK